MPCRRVPDPNLEALVGRSVLIAERLDQDDLIGQLLDLFMDGPKHVVGIATCGSTKSRSNAGHLSPLLINGDRVDYVRREVGVPLGVGGQGYQSVTFSSPPNSTLIAFTDGLVERRGEVIDLGLDRLKQSAAMGREPLEEMLGQMITTLTHDASEDDMAVLALRRLN